MKPSKDEPNANWPASPINLWSYPKMNTRTFIKPQHTLNVEKVRDHTKDVYDWLPKEDGYYIQVVNTEAYSKTGNLMPGLPPMGFRPDIVYEMEAYAETLGATKSALGRKQPRWDLVNFLIHNFIEEGLLFHEKNQILLKEKQVSQWVRPISLTGTIAEAEAYAEAVIYPAGGEGLVGRLRGNLKHHSGSRNKTLVKVKANCYFKAIFLQAAPNSAQGFFKTLPDGVPFTSKINTEKMAATLKPGQQVTVRCMCINPSGAPRDPVIWEY